MASSKIGSPAWVGTSPGGVGAPIGWGSAGAGGVVCVGEVALRGPCSGGIGDSATGSAAVSGGITGGSSASSGGTATVGSASVGAGDSGGAGRRSGTASTPAPRTPLTGAGSIRPVGSPTYSRSASASPRAVWKSTARPAGSAE